MEIEKERKKIMFSGGGTGGSVSPLLAVAQELRLDSRSWQFVFVGGQGGPEEKMIDSFSPLVGGLPFRHIIAGKWRRYLSWQNLGDIFRVVAALFQSLRLLSQEKPAIVISAGSFVSVPLVWAAAIKRIPVLIHQQDARPGLANRLMAPFARVITVNFEKSLLDYGPRAVCVGNPLLIEGVGKKEEAIKQVKEKYGLADGLPLVVLTGGRLGAGPLNHLLWSARSRLENCQVIHLSGEGKDPSKPGENAPGYYRIIESLPHQETLILISAADLVISRAGLGIMTELSLLNKPAIIIPIPGSHQEDNAAVFSRAKAAVVLDQRNISPESLADNILRLLAAPEEMERLAMNISSVIKHGAAKRLALIVKEVLGKEK